MRCGRQAGVEAQLSRDELRVKALQTLGQRRRLLKESQPVPAFVRPLPVTFRPPAQPLLCLIHRRYPYEIPLSVVATPFFFAARRCRIFGFITTTTAISR